MTKATRNIRQGTTAGVGGDGYKIASDGKTPLSAGGFASVSSTIWYQSSELRATVSTGRRWFGNGHLDITRCKAPSIPGDCGAI
jgi:hypothetical protein